MGRAAAWDLARQPGVDLVRLIDRDERALQGAERELARLLAPGAPERRAKVEAERFDLEAPAPLARLMGSVHVVLSSADYRYNELVTRAAIEARVHLCDLGGNLSVVDRQLALDAEAKRAGITVIPDCGLAPGMACLLAAWGVERLDSVERVRIRVGGLPAHPKPPLGYKLVFSVRGLTNEYLEPAEVLRGGRRERVASLTEPEPIEFPSPFGTLEAFHTSGGASTLPRTLQGKVQDLDYKTLRYPGHLAAFAGMQALGLFSEEPVSGVVPRTFTETLLERALTDDDTDVVLARVTVAGTHAGAAAELSFEVVDRHDPATGHSAMARTTAYSASAVAYMLGVGAITRRGVLPGERCVPLDAFVQAVRARGIDILEQWRP